MIGAVVVAAASIVARVQAQGSKTVAVPDNKDIEVRSLIRSALGVRTDSSGIVKCGFGLSMAAYRARATASADLQPLLQHLLSRVERQKQRTSGYFTVHYDTTGNSAPALLDASYARIPGTSEAFVDSVLTIANRVYAFEVDTLGYAAPPSDGTAGGGPEYDIYIMDLGSEYGETMPEVQLDMKPDGGTFTSYETIDNDFVFVSPDSNRGIPAMKVTVAHEFHHAIQLGSYGFWTSELFFYELSSTWMETMAFPEVPDYLNYVRSRNGQLQNPGTPFTEANGLIEYSRCLWGIYLAAEFSPAIMLEVWQQIRYNEPLGAQESVFERHSTNFASVFSEWNIWNYYTADRARPASYYPKGSLYPLVAATGIDFIPASGQQPFDGSLPSLSARYYEISAQSDTAMIIITNLDVATALSTSIPSRPYTMTLSNSAIGAGFEHVADGCFFAMTYDDPTVWKAWVVAGGSSVVSGLKEGIPFPNPFRNSGTGKLYIPADGTSGTLRIYNNAMGLVYENQVRAGLMFGKTVFAWDGRTLRGDLATSGVYFFTLEYSGTSVTGKFVILRNSR